LGACEVFTSSWAPWAARDLNAILPEVNSGNARDMVDQFADDPDMSLEILKKIAAAINKTKSPEEKTKLRTAALDAAINASGIMDAFIGSITDFLEDDKRDLKMVVDTFGGIKNTESISTSLVSSFSEVAVWETQDDKRKIADSADNSAQLLLSALLIAKNELEKNGGDFSVERIESISLNDPNLRVPIAMVYAAGEKESNIQRIIVDIIEKWTE
jgi:hypothetical protein